MVGTLLAREGIDPSFAPQLGRLLFVYRNVRARVFPCEGIPEAADFDFWVGRWEVRLPDGTLGVAWPSLRDGFGRTQADFQRIR